jgi:hypothetical protein
VTSRQSNFRPVKWLSAGLMLSAFFSCPLLAQEPTGTGTSGTSSPDAPKAQSSTNPAVKTTTRFVGYMTNKSIIFPDIAFSEGPLMPDGKFKLFVNQSISPPYILVAALGAAYDQAVNTPKDYGQGWDAYAGRFGDDVARASSDSFFGTFVFASALHQDPRFFPQSGPSVWGSIKYSAQRVFVTRTDSGRDTFNTSGLAGSLAAEALANVYLPASERTAAQSCERVGIDLAWKFAGNMFKNYWATVFLRLKLNRLKVIPDPGLPETGAPD